MSDKPTPSLQDFVPFAFGLSPSAASTPPPHKGFADQNSPSPYSNNLRSPGNGNNFSSSKNKFASPRNRGSPINKFGSPQNKFNCTRSGNHFNSPGNHFNSPVNHNSPVGYRNSSSFRRSHSNYYDMSPLGLNYSDCSPNTSNSRRSSSFSSFNSSSFDMQENNDNYSKYLHPSFTEDPWEQLRRQRQFKKVDK